MPLPEADVARRLALLRLSLGRAGADANAPPPFCFDAVNTVHNAVETFLALAAQHLDAPIPKDFLAYWDVLGRALGRALTHKPRLQRLNKLRVNLKHYGIEPAPSEIQEAVSAAIAFIEDECPPIFGVQLADASPTRLVRSGLARTLLESAEARWSAGDAQEALADLSEAFDAVLDDYETRKSTARTRSVFDTTADTRFLTPFHRGVTDRDQRRFEEALIKSLDGLNRAVKVIGFGVDFRLFGRFRALTPHVFHTMDGSRHVYPSTHSPHVRTDDFRFCRDFVVTTALQLALVDYDLPSADITRPAGEQDDSSSPETSPSAPL